MLIVCGVLLAALAAVPVGVVWIEHRQAAEHRRFSERAGPLPARRSDVAVIVYSRSGSTAVLARHIAGREGADFFRLEAADYALGMQGWIRALKDAGRHEAGISPQALDLRGYRRVYLGSPIWLYSPAPPLWEFIQRNDFTGIDVVLFNTFNSRFEPERIAAFKQQLRARGARSFAHQHIRRGRMGQQLPVTQMLQEFDATYPGR